MSFANKLKQCRLRKGQSLQEVADDLGISKAHFWELETGTTDILIKLSNHIGVSIGWLLGEEETSTEDDKMKVLFRGLQTLDPADVDLIQSMVNNFNDRKK
jgi:transcriptional regulator with XRE-family HTH domain